jgi:aspartate dehydrogenase
VLNDTGSPVVLFEGSAREAATRYPLNANVVVVSALSTVGLDQTRVELVSDSTAATNRHEIHAVGDFGSLTLTLENRPLASNPRSSELAALALVRLAENEVAEPVVMPPPAQRLILPRADGVSGSADAVRAKARSR